MSKENIPVNSIYAHDEEAVRKQAFELVAMAILRKPVLGEVHGSTINSVLDPATGVFR